MIWPKCQIQINIRQWITVLRITLQESYLMALDQGTSSSRAIIYDRKGEVLSSAQTPIGMMHPRDGWVEQDPEEIWTSILDVGRRAIATREIDPTVIRAIGITNQRETTLVWSKLTGECIYNAIVWQDRRTASICDRMKSEVWNDLPLEDYIKEKTGLIIDPYFSSTKLAWILKEVVEKNESINPKDLLFGTVDSYLIWKLTAGRSHATDVTNASRTQLLNIELGEWDQSLLEYFNISIGLLPTVKNSADEFGTTDASCFGAAIPITGVAGDQQAALIGQCCFEEGMSKVTLGTGCFIMTNTGAKRSPATDGLLTTIAYGLDGKITYASEGSVFVAGQAVKWLRDQLGIIKSAIDTEKAFVKTQGDSGGVTVVPAFTGLGAPYWDAEARGLISGLTLDTTPDQIIVATVQSIAYQIADLVDIMAENGAVAGHFRIDGGMSVNRFFCQFLSDILDLAIERPVDIETTAKGAALLAALGADIWPGFEETKELWSLGERFLPNMKAQARQDLRNQFAVSIHRATLRP